MDPLEHLQGDAKPPTRIIHFPSTVSSTSIGALIDYKFCYRNTLNIQVFALYIFLLLFNQMAAHRRLLSFFLCLSVRLCSAAITVHYVPGQEPLSAASSTSSAAAADYTGAAAYNPIRLEAPPIPNPLPAMTFPIQLQSGGTQGVSIPQNGGFLGFSIEMSVANQVRECTFHFVDSVFLLIPSPVGKNS